MSLTAYRLIALIFLLPFLQTNAQNVKPQLQKEPAWITSIPISYNDSSLDADAEEGVIDLDYEKQTALETESVFTRHVIKFLSESGVQNSSQISIDYDPAYQQLIFHKINLIRNGRVIDKLQLSKIKTVQQEKDMNDFIYNGSLTAMLLLEDVQKGDVLEYSYTIKGFNPIFGGRYSGMLSTRFSVPMYHVYYKLLAPAGTPLTIKNSQTDIQPTVVQTGNGTVYEWRLVNCSALHVEDNTPSWYDPFPMIMISGFKNWKDVNDWALTLFPFHVPLSKALQAKVAELKQLSPDPQVQAAAAIRFVQDDIRYQGIEMGENSHKPHQPDQILRQRFGDCKDKSYLLCTLLRGLGIDAHPVLINSSYKKTISAWLPAPIDFDHTTVQVQLNGKQYWFDPTISYQRGALDAISYPDYGAGLVISDTTTQLTTIPFQPKGQVRVNEIFNIPNIGSRVQLKVITAYSGSFADDTRSDFKSTSNYELLKNYTNYYAYYFKKIKADSLTSADDEITGVFTTTEYYTLDSLWGASAIEKQASFEPYVINSFLKKPNGNTRTMPYALRFPAHYIEEIEINLPDSWNIDHSGHASASSAFKINADYSSAGNQVLLKYDFEMLKDHITPEELPDYVSKIDKADAGIAYTLTSTPTTEGASRYVTASKSNYASLYLALGLCVFITYTVRSRNKIRG